MVDRVESCWISFPVLRNPMDNAVNSHKQQEKWMPVNATRWRDQKWVSQWVHLYAITPKECMMVSFFTDDIWFAILNMTCHVPINVFAFQELSPQRPKLKKKIQSAEIPAETSLDQSNSKQFCEQFCRWFFQLLNSQNPSSGQDPTPGAWGPENFCIDAKLNIISRYNY